MLRQYGLTTVMGKRLIARAMAQHPAVRGAIEGGTLVIVAGTTNGYVAEEVLGGLGQGEGFERLGYRRGMTVPSGVSRPHAPFPGDVVIRQGAWQRGLTIYDVVDDLRADDVILKGANAYDPYGHPAVQIGHPQGGTVLEACRAVIGHRARLLVPVGLEKRVYDDVHDLALLCNASDATGLRLFPFPGEVFTELDAIALLTGAEAVLLAAGGVLGAEGSYWLGVTGDEAQLDAVDELVRSLVGEPPCVA